MYPPEILWPVNVDRSEHLPPADHPRFYRAAGFTLNVTRAEMREAGYSPSVRLFEAAACGATIISDRWAGIDTIFQPGKEILLAESADDVVETLRATPPAARRAIGSAARRRVLSEHTARHRVTQLHRLVREAREEPVR
jgi:spore maturation protein CgeB